MNFFKWKNPFWFFLGVAASVITTYFLGLNVVALFTLLGSWCLVYITIAGGIEILF